MGNCILSMIIQITWGYGMITECFNPSCRARLHYLRDGRVIRVVHEDLDGFRIEHFWLCGSCYLSHDFRFTKDGALSISPRSEHGGTPDRPEPDRPQLEWIEEPVVIESSH
jgi:hypothetical protein